MRYHVVDAFADPRFGGNPAAVVLAGQDGAAEADEVVGSGELMQAAAHRIGVPTTAFLRPTAPGEYRIRWYTPEAEVNLCGHASIASARYLFGRPADADRPLLRFVSDNGVITAERVGEQIVLTLPRPALVAAEPPAGLVEALGVRPVACALSSDDTLVEVATVAEVAALRPDFAALARLPYRGHIVTAAGPAGDPVGDGVRDDFVSRTFFPALGLDEDQVCVTAHTKLAPYWAARTGRRRFSALQLSQRGGRLDVEDAPPDRVRVVGTAVARFSGDVLLGTPSAR